VVKLPPTPEELAKPHLKLAEEECQRAVDEHVKSLNVFFADAKKNTRPFAEEALSWASKRRLIADHVPYTAGGRHEKYLRERFEELVFKPAQLEATVDAVIRSYMDHVRSIEGKMLVNLRADVSDFPDDYMLAQIDDDKVREIYDKTIAEAGRAAVADLRGNMGTELVSLITSEVLTQVAIRIGISTTILEGGAASSLATLGAGFVIGLIVDQIVSWVWDWWADPTGNLAGQLDKKLDEINRLLVDGTDKTQGLRQRLQQCALDRSKLRDRAVASMLRASDGGGK
jgi:hypothetical protein